MADNDLMEARRKSILDAAAAAFDAHGYAATTIDEVAARAGMSKGSIYNYFKSKSDLFNQLFARMNATDAASAEPILAGPTSATAKIEGLLEFWHQGLEERKSLGSLTLEFWATASRQPSSRGLTELLQETVRHWESRIAQVIAEGVSADEFHPEVEPHAAAAWLIGLLNGLALHMILNISGSVDKLLLASLKRSVLRALGARTLPADAGDRETGGKDV